MVQKDITNYKFNKLTAVEFYKKDKFGKLYWLFKCDCGNKKVINKNKVVNGYTKSCGCLEMEYKFKPTHGLSKKNKKAYGSWSNMLQRCNNKKHKDYVNYGGRGIKVCEKWMKFENFLKDMGDRPIKTSLDRIDNSGNYEPSNCRWATSKEQISNTRRVIMITFNNKTKIAKEWAKFYNLDYWNFLYYYKKNNNIEFAIKKAKKAS